MHYSFQVIYATLQAVAAAIFHPWFFLVIYLVYRMHKKNSEIEIQSLLFTKQKISSRMIQSTLIGILVGIGASIIMTLIGLPIYLSEYMFFLLPVALLLAMINFRYLCFSYAGGLLGILSFFFRGQMFMGYELPNMNLDIPGIITLVGILHLMESGLIFIEGAEDCIPITIRKEGKIAGAYMMQKYWPLPFALLVMSVMSSAPQGSIEMPDWWPLMKNIIDNPNMVLVYSIYPITAILGYGDIAVSTTPEKKSKKTALSLMLYSIILIIIALLTPNRIWLQIIGIILMPVLHEILIVQSQKRERQSEPLFTYPNKGVRILDLKPEGVGEKIGLKRGDIIVEINGIKVQNFVHMKAILNNYYTFLWLNVIEAGGKDKYIEFKAYPDGINSLDIVPLIEQPLMVYRLENMESIGLFQMITAKK